MNNTLKTVGIVSIFSAAMAALEGAVVVYLRTLYYPDAFTVSFRIVDSNILLVEIVREAATLVMLLGVAYLAGKNFRERFAYFLLSFAVWDILYYGWLKIFIGWPSSFFDWDILFLIPVTWIGPVAAPVICSITMIVLAAILLTTRFSMSKTVWACLVLGSTLVLFTFMRDYTAFIVSHGFAKDFPNLLQNERFVREASDMDPKPYAWNIFWAGECMFIIGMVSLRINRNITAEALTLNNR